MKLHWFHTKSDHFDLYEAPMVWVWTIISYLLTNVQLMLVILNRSRIARWWARVVCFSFGTRTMIMCNLNFIQWGVTDLIACYLGLRIKIELGFILSLLYDTCHSQTSQSFKVITCKKFIAIQHWSFFKLLLL